MRIAILCQSYPPMISGASLFAGSLAEGLANRGHRVLVLAASDTGRPYETIRGDLAVHRLRSHPNRLRVGQRMAAWPFGAIRRRLDAFRPDVIHLHAVFTVGLAGIRAGRRLGVPVLLTAHQLPGFLSTYLGPLSFTAPVVERFFWGYTRFLDRHAFLIAPTPAAAEEIKACCDVDAAVIGYGLELDRFHSRPLLPEDRARLCQKYALDPDTPILLHVGRLDTDKNVQIVIEAAAQALQQTNGQLLVIGDGQQRIRLEALADRLGLADRCRFTGFIPPDGDLPDIYRAAAVFAIASEIETQGLVVLEAMAAGLPVVAVRATCMPEIVRDEQNGFLVAPKDSAGMAERITRLLADPETAAVMGAEGARIARQHSRSRSIALYEAQFAGLLREKSLREAQKPHRIGKISSTNRARQPEKRS